MRTGEVGEGERDGGEKWKMVVEGGVEKVEAGTLVEFCV